MLDTIKFNDKDYEVKRKLSWKEVTEFQKSVGNLLSMENKLKNATLEQLTEVAVEGLEYNEAQKNIVANTIMSCLGFTQEELDVLPFTDAVMLFNEIYKDSTQIKKNLSQPYA